MLDYAKQNRLLDWHKMKADLFVEDQRGELLSYENLNQILE